MFKTPHPARAGKKLQCLSPVSAATEHAAAWRPHSPEACEMFPCPTCSANSTYSTVVLLHRGRISANAFAAKTDDSASREKKKSTPKPTKHN